MEILDNHIFEEELSEKEADWKLFIGDKFDYYLPVWQKMEQGQKIHFNLSAFIFWVGWAAFRKMYLIYFLLFAARQVTNYLPFLFNASPELTLFIEIMFFFVYLAWGFYANWAYYNHAQKKIASIKTAGLSKVLEEKSIRDAGQTDIQFPIFMGIVLFVLTRFIETFLGII
ncbi:DUF2628 domain-containing protein [Aureispira sp. CCB-E]|uniref:DUF2628 domain-containing protein n=1 Tax=Aureispira sp. CCB-E TaxID=3051121 RepID=UPI00286967A3|nr:DUF2628 domain-containing protein [Aureispira sp. CCB-E]WMX12020.1 DUF2628 domain-containing protein [Aureispira sp. CCB-E]